MIMNIMIIYDGIDCRFGDSETIRSSCFVRLLFMNLREFSTCLITFMKNVLFKLNVAIYFLQCFHIWDLDVRGVHKVPVVVSVIHL